MSDPHSRVVGALDTVGRTPLVELKRVVPPDHARVFVKVEGQNPTGSMKDRMAVAVLEGALASGRLRPDGTVVEYTGGSTGTSLAFACGARGIPLTVVTSDAFSREKRDHMRAMGATVVEVPSEGGRTTKALIERMIAEATGLAEEPGAYLVDQFNNTYAAAGYASLADEIWRQTDGRVDAFVQAVGTGQCLKGVSEGLRARDADVRMVAVEPAESAVLSGGEPGAHDIEGVGPGFVPPMWDPGVVDRIIPVLTSESVRMARRLAAEEALFAGTSSGANVVAAIDIARRLGPGHHVVTLLCDTGLKYVSTELYSSAD